MSPSVHTGRKPVPVTTIHPREVRYPAVLRSAGISAPLHVIGDPAVLTLPSLALFCSVKCPGSVILNTYEAMQRLKLQDRVIAGGFHSPMERACLDILLRGRTTLVICPARGIRRLRLRPEWRCPLSDNRLLVVSPFDDPLRRSTKQLALARNRFVAALADALFIPYAARKSLTERFAVEMLSDGKMVYTLPDPESQPLIDLGATLLPM